MHFAIGILTLIAVWKWGDWKNWRIYHTSMMYFALGNLLYNFLTANHFLWKLKPDFLPNHSLTEMVYTFITFPATSLIYLSRYPQASIKKQIVYILEWVCLYAGVEAILMFAGRMQYQFGWNYWWSVVFDCTMFPMLRLFFKKPLLAYVISAALCVFWIWLFDVPVNIPVEERR